MLSRILWIGLAVLALVGGILYQNRGFLIGGSDGVAHRVIEAQVRESVRDRVTDHMTVVGADGRKVDLPRQTKEELGDAVGELIAAKAELALLRARDVDPAEVRAAEQRSAKAQANVERIKDKIDQQKQLSRSDRDAVRTQIRDQVRDAVRDTVRN